LGLHLELGFSEFLATAFGQKYEIGSVTERNGTRNVCQADSLAFETNAKKSKRIDSDDDNVNVSVNVDDAGDAADDDFNRHPLSTLSFLSFGNRQAKSIKRKAGKSRVICFSICQLPTCLTSTLICRVSLCESETTLVVCLPS